MLYDFYHRRLAGDPALLPDMNQPQAGFYRHRDGDPVAYFYDTGDEDSDIPSAEVPLVCLRGQHDKQRRVPELEALELWPWVCWNAVPEAEWRKAYAGGEWSDEAPGLGHNRPPDSTETPEQTRAKVVKLATEWLEATPEVTTKRQADQAAHYMTTLRNLATDLEREEAEQKKPFQAFVKQLISTYRGWREPLDAMREKLRARLKPYLDKIDKANEEARREAQRVADEAGAKGQRPPAEAKAPTTRVGGTGHAVSLRSYWSAEITDYVAALEAAGTEPEVREAVQAVANRYARNSSGKAPLPGTKALEDRR